MSGKKEIIRQAAIETFANKGFYFSTTDLIAEKSGVAVGTIYNYFKNKQDILEYICQVEFEKRKAFFDELQKQDLDPVEKIRKIIQKHFDEVRENPLLVKIILRERQNTDSYSVKKSGLKIIIAKVLKEGMEEGKLRELNPEVLSTIIFGSIEAVMGEYLESYEENNQRPEIFDEALKNIIILLEKGVIIQ